MVKSSKLLAQSKPNAKKARIKTRLARSTVKASRAEDKLSLIYADLIGCLAVSSDQLERKKMLLKASKTGVKLVNQLVNADVILEGHRKSVKSLRKTYPGVHMENHMPTPPPLEISLKQVQLIRKQIEERYRAILDARLQETHRLESLGALAVGIAHDFNNILGCISGFAEMTSDYLVEGSPDREHVRQILQACKRARDLVERMLAYAKAEPGKPERQDLIQQVLDAVVMLSQTLGSNVRIEFNTELAAATVLAEPGQIQQIVMNLCINANEAGCGNIRVGLWEETKAAQQNQVGQGREYCLSIADDGPGIEAENQEHVFEPFFSTKTYGGSGLGLSVIADIVTQLGGCIYMCSSRCNGDYIGTDFRVYLPRAEEPKADCL